MNDDLTPLFAGPPMPPGQEMRYWQGVIVTFNPTTLENTIDVGGTVFTNLKVLGLAEAATLVPGAVVGIVSIGGSSKTMAIVGRWVTPNTPEASSALSFLGGFVKGDRITASDTITSTSYAAALVNPGPTVTDVRIGPSQSALVICTANLQCNEAATIVYMSYTVSGATTVAADDTRAVKAGVPGSAVGAEAFERQAAVTLHTASVVPLNAGLNTFTAQYRRINAAGLATVSARDLVVIPL